MSQTKNVFQRIHAVQADMKTIEKKGRNDFHKYNYATEADFVHALRPLLDKHGLVVIPSVLEHSHVSVGEKGDYLTTVKMNYRVCTIDDPFIGVDCIVLGQGTDKGDKGTYKAMTGAKKYFIAQTFMVATGDDPENEEKPKTRSLGGSGTNKSKGGVVPLSSGDF